MMQMPELTGVQKFLKKRLNGKPLQAPLHLAGGVSKERAQ